MMNFAPARATVTLGRTKPEFKSFEGLNARGWQLYSSMKVSNLVAVNLNRAMKKALTVLALDIKAGMLAQKAAVKAFLAVEKVRESPSAVSCGAADTEPREISADIIEAEVRHHTGNAGFRFSF